MAGNLATLAPTNAVGDINKYNFHTDTQDVSKARRGLDAAIVSQISAMKGEPAWMRNSRLHALAIFEYKLTPKWGGGIAIPFQDIYYLKPTDKQRHTWEEGPEEMRKTFERLGIPEAERKFLSGVKEQWFYLMSRGLSEPEASTMIVNGFIEPLVED